MLILRSRVFLFSVLAVLPLILSAFTTSPATAQGAGEISFVFAASGDLNSPIKGAGSDSLRSLKSLNPTPDFFLGLGDLSYNASYTGTKWCSDFKNQFSNIEIIPGYHDTGDDANLSDTSATRNYQKFIGSTPPPTGCPYTIDGVSSLPPCERFGCDYGREYYFDYPPTGVPIARFVMLSPDIYNITGRCFAKCITNSTKQCDSFSDCWNYRQSDLKDKDYTYNYTNFGNHYNWTQTVIENAHENDEWVIVGVHKLCISAGSENCEIGTDLLNLLLREKVDLMLSGDDHAYERSKQLSLNSTFVNGQPICDGVPLNLNTWAVYNPGCVVDDGSKGFYLPEAGTVIVITGTFGRPLYSVNDTFSNADCVGCNAAEAPYFAKLMGQNTPGNSNGFVTYGVTGKRGNEGRIDVQTHFAGSFQDAFSITPPPVSTVKWSPDNPSAGNMVFFSTSTAGGVPPYLYNWSFGDGATATGPTPTHVYASIGYFKVIVTTTDSAGNSRTKGQLLGIGSWNPAVPCSPTLSTLEEMLGSVTVRRVSSNPNSTGADYSGGSFQLEGHLTYGANPSLWPFSKRQLYPFSAPLSSPCSTPTGIPAFIEINSLTVSSLAVSDCGIRFDSSNGGDSFPNGQTFCSTTFSLASSTPPCPACYMHRIYAVIDRDWKAEGIAPASPEQGQTIDVQGFVYWNPQWVEQPWHSYTGWELHVTAWRISTTPIPAPASLFSGNGLWYVLGALGITVVLVSAYGTRFPTRIKTFVSRSKLAAHRRRQFSC
ncbi:PKD domain-containing protein [Candidatus Bathyarchaeota archaeon]|nr:MAG: PKD domain-containing protein [Candidatus Bathyarchaeota archaeon]